MNRKTLYLSMPDGINFMCKIELHSEVYKGLCKTSMMVLLCENS